jgi:ubiquinone/menaquinone biosynthesis C-methylase UbiE
MADTRSGQIAATAAEIYDQFFVPALFAEWAPRLCDAAVIGEGQTVVDIGCGTGVAARTAAARVGPSGAVTGVDVNEGMLAVATATRCERHVETRSGRGAPVRR